MLKNIGLKRDSETVKGALTHTCSSVPTSWAALRKTRGVSSVLPSLGFTCCPCKREAEPQPETLEKSHEKSIQKATFHLCNGL